VTDQSIEFGADVVYADRDSPWRQVWRRLAQRPAALVGFGVIVFFIAIAIAAPAISPYDPVATDWLAVRKPPSMLHLFGTDEIGRDVLSRIIWGTRVALEAGLVSVSIALAVGMSIGLICGYCSGILDGVVMRAIDAMLAIPFLILAIACPPSWGQT
jgi:peptide/nickel transport system permease protein